MKLIPSLSLALTGMMLLGGCAAQKAEHDRLVSERNQIQSDLDTEKQQHAAAATRASELEASLTSTKAELEKAKSDLAAQQAAAAAAQQTADDNLRKAKVDTAEVEATLKTTQNELAATKANIAAQSTTLTEKIVVLQKQIETLTAEKAAMRSEMKKADLPTTTPMP